MKIPLFWANARIQFINPDPQAKKRHINLRRLGWSNTSYADALQMAQIRANEAKHLVLQDPTASQTLVRYENQVKDPDTSEVLIREEIVGQHAHATITRSDSGALYLNAAHIPMLDIPVAPPPEQGCAAFFIFAAITWMMFAWYQVASLNNVDAWSIIFCTLKIVLGGFFLAICSGLVIFALVNSLLRFWQNRILPRIIRFRIWWFSCIHRDWVFNLYKTHSGYRIIILSPALTPSTPEKHLFWPLPVTAKSMRAIFSDHGFRVQVTPSPDTIGVSGKMTRSHRKWLSTHTQLARRQTWIMRYNQASTNYSTCHFIRQYGKGKPLPESIQCCQLHDVYTKTNQKHLPLA